MLKLLPRLTAFSAILFSLAMIQDFRLDPSTEISGIVIDSKTKEPVNSAHVYVVVGEEEALTGKDGQFRFTTWKSFPLSISASHQDYQKKVVRVTNASKEIRIELVKN